MRNTKIQLTVPISDVIKKFPNDFDIRKAGTDEFKYYIINKVFDVMFEKNDIVDVAFYDDGTYEFLKYYDSKDSLGIYEFLYS